jgi:hypothetical protein
MRTPEEIITAQVQEFNAWFPVGSPVHLRRRNTLTPATVRQAAHIVRRGRVRMALARFEGLQGDQAIDRVVEWKQRHTAQLHARHARRRPNAAR